MNNNSNKMPTWLAVVLSTCFLTGIVVLLAAGAGLTIFDEPAPEPLPPPIEEPEPWKGRMECRHGSLTLYTANNLVDYIVSAQPSGWMWEMFMEDGTVVLFHQPERVFCFAIPEESGNEHVQVPH